MLRVDMAQLGRIGMEGPGRDRVAAVAGILSVVVFVIGQYVAPALVWPAEQVGGLVATLFPFAVFLGAAAAVVLRTGVLVRWLGGVGVAFGLVVGMLAAGSIAGLDIGPADQVVFLLVSAWLAVLAFGVGWPLPSAARRVDEAVD
jgi:hypothetical protein